MSECVHALAGTARPGLDTKKKTFAACEQDPLERALGRGQQIWLALPACALVFVDESGSNQALAPRYGAAPKGQRSHGQVPRNRGKNTSILAAMSGAGLVGTMTVEGAPNQEVFWTDLDRVLCPARRPGQIVVMDNLAAHQNETVREKIEARGCRLLFWPADSPDCNPIEHAFAKLKPFLRRAKARTQETLEAAIAAGLATLTAHDARGWFKHGQFSLPAQLF